MKKLFLYSLLLYAFTFSGCKKEDTDPAHNKLVIVDRNGNTTISPPLTVTDISGSFDPSFGASAKTPNGDYRFSIGTFKSSTPSSITFTSPEYSNEIGMYVGNTAGSWAATGGTAYIDSKSGSALFLNGGTKFIKVTFNNVQFTNAYNYSNPNAPADTIWVSGVIKMNR